MHRIHRTTESSKSSHEEAHLSHRPTAWGGNQQRLQSLEPSPETQICEQDWGASMVAQLDRDSAKEADDVAVMEAQMQDCLDGGYQFDAESGECAVPRSQRAETVIEECRDPALDRPDPFARIAPLGPDRRPSISADRSRPGSRVDACSDTEIQKRVMRRQRANVMRAMMPTKRAPFAGDRYYQDLRRERKICGK